MTCMGVSNLEVYVRKEIRKEDPSSEGLKGWNQGEAGTFGMVMQARAQRMCSPEALKYTTCLGLQIQQPSFLTTRLHTEAIGYCQGR